MKSKKKLFAATMAAFALGALYAAPGFYQSVYTTGSDVATGDPMTDEGAVVVPEAGFTILGKCTTVTVSGSDKGLNYSVGGETHVLGKNTTAAYAAYWHMTAGTVYKFSKGFDDSGRITITAPDGTATEVLHDTSYKSLPYKTYEPSASGWYKIDLRVGQGGGGVGPYSSPFSSADKIGAGLVWTTDETVTQRCDDNTYALWNRFENPAEGAPIFMTSQFDETTSGRYADGSLTVSCVLKALPGDSADLKVAMAYSDGSVTNYALAAKAVVRSNPYSVKIDGLAANASYQYCVVAAVGEEEFEGAAKTLYTGTISVAKGADADVNAGQPGSFVISRGTTAEATGNPLVVKYADSGTGATAGVDYETLPGTVTIPAGVSSATVGVVPVAHVGGTDGVLTLSLSADDGYAIAADGGSAAIALAKLTSYWTYNATSKTITDGDNWTLSVMASGSELTITGVSTQGVDATALNLAKPVLDANETAYKIVTIKDKVFTSRTTLESVVLPQTLASIGSNAFSGCPALKSVTPFLPDAVTYIGTYAFANSPVETDLLVLGRDHAVTLAVAGGGSESAAFKASNVRRVVFGKHITSIGATMFSSCTNLESVVFEGDVTKIYGSVFQNCTALRTVTPLLPPTVSHIGTCAFKNCPVGGRLELGKEVSVSFGTTGGDKQSSAFANTGIGELVVGEKMTDIPAYLTYGTVTLTNLVLHDAIASIGGSAFKDCTALKTVSPLLPKSISAIGTQTFMNCPLEGTLHFGGDSNIVQSVYSGASLNDSFSNTKIASFVLGTNQTTLANCLCDKCASLTRADLSAATNLTSIGTAFQNCAALTDVVFAELKPSWGSNAFLGGPTDYASRLLFPKKSSTWSDYIASLGTGFKAWSTDVSEEEKSKYATAFPDGPEPRGYATLDSRKKWLVPYSEAVAGQVQLRITSEPPNIGTATPGYGDKGVVTTPYAASVEPYGEADNAAYESYGYRIEKFSDVSWEEVKTVVGARSVDFAPDADGEYRIVWLFKPAAYALDMATVDPAYGSVSVQGSVLDAPSLSGTYYVSNTVVTLTATDASLAFKRWYGEVAEGEETSRTISVTMDHPCAVDAYFETPWTYDASKNQISDGYWTLNVAGKKSALNVTGASVTPAALTLLDLAKGTDGHVVTRINEKAFRYQTALAELRLPETLAAIGNEAFRSCTALAKVTPFLPEAVTTIGAWAFYECPVEADTLVIGRDHEVTLAVSGGDSYSGAFAGTKIRRLVLGQHVTVVGGSMFENCSHLESVVFEGNVTTLYNSVFRNCTALASVTPLLPATVTTVGVWLFQNAPVEGVLSLGGEGCASDVSFNRTGGNDTSQAFANTKISEFVAGPKVTLLRTGLFEGATALRNVVLHDAITNIDQAAFKNCTALKTVSPLLPKRIAHIGLDAFNGSAVEGSLTIGKNNDFGWSYAGGDYHNCGFANTRISELHFGPKASSVPGMFCQNCTNLVNAYFDGYPAFGGNAFYGVSANARFYLNRNSAEWDEWLANPANAMAWTDLSPEAQQSYYDVYGAGAKRPVARAVTDRNPFPKGSWLLRFTDDGCATVFTIR